VRTSDRYVYRLRKLHRCICRRTEGRGRHGMWQSGESTSGLESRVAGSATVTSLDGLLEDFSKLDRLARSAPRRWRSNPSCCRVTKRLRFSLSRRTVSAEYLCCGTLTWRRSIGGRIYGKRWEGVGNDLGESGQAHVLRVRDRTGVLPGGYAKAHPIPNGHSSKPLNG
jgi:hypothetical protein